jgi:hypothetical protein
LNILVAKNGYWYSAVHVTGRASNILRRDAHTKVASTLDVLACIVLTSNSYLPFRWIQYTFHHLFYKSCSRGGCSPKQHALSLSSRITKLHRRDARTDELRITPESCPKQCLVTFCPERVRVQLKPSSLWSATDGLTALAQDDQVILTRWHQRLPPTSVIV